MTDLATALQQVLRQVRESIPHSSTQPRHVWQERVEAEQARRWQVSLEAARRGLLFAEIPGTFEAFVIGAAQQERGSA